jgi:anaerobic selenocysteine-containing dehydrogenase
MKNFTGVVNAVCPHDCPDTCALRVTVENGKAIKVQGNPDHPPTDGVLCTKVSRYTERTYHPDRLMHPMRRVGKKGEGRFERISWDEAFRLAADRLKPIVARNPEALLPYSLAPHCLTGRSARQQAQRALNIRTGRASACISNSSRTAS